MKKIIEHFNLKQFNYFSFLIIITAILGIIIHELGHFTAGKLMGFTPTLHYGSVTFENDKFFQQLDYHKISAKLNDEIQSVKVIWMVWGPLTNILIGVIGFLIIVLYNKGKTMKEVNLINLVALLASLLLLRQIINYLSVIVKLLFHLHSLGGDESVVDTIYKLPLFTTLAITAIFSVIIFSITLFHFVPKTQRFTFFCSVGAGGFIGSGLWLFILGPIILPYQVLVKVHQIVLKLIK
jgi:hypothetical protein